MSVVSKNPFDLLGDDGEGSPAPAAAPKKAGAPAATSADAPAAARNVPGSHQQNRGGAGGRGRGNYPNRGRGGGNRGGDTERTVTNDQPRNTGPTSGDGVEAGFETPGGFDGERVAAPKRFHRGPDAHTKGPRGNRPVKNYTSGGHTSSRGDHVGRPRAPQDGGERRQYERRSGGVGGDSQKKIDIGWVANEGTAELKAEQAGEADAQKEEIAPQTPGAEDGGWGAAEANNAPAAVEAAEVTPVAPEEPEEVTKSYDEYLAEKAAAASEFGKKEGRKVTSESLEGTAFTREGVDDFFSGKDKATKAKTSAPKKEKVYIEVDGQFATPPGGGDRGARGGRGGVRGGDRGGRGGFGGERGGRGRGAFGGGERGRGGPRGAGRGGNAQNAGVDASDESAFPALGA